MQVAFYLAGEITQVKESIPGVRCASGNVFLSGQIIPPMTAGLCPSNFFQEKTTYRLKCNFCIQWFHIYIYMSQASKKASEGGKLTDDSGSVGCRCPTASRLNKLLYFLFNSNSSLFSTIQFKQVSLTIWLQNTFLCIDLCFYVRGIPPLCISSCGLRNPFYCLYTGNFTIQLKLYYTAETLLYSCNFTIQL